MNANPENTRSMYIVNFTNGSSCFVSSARGDGVYLNGILQAGWTSINDFIDYATPIWNAIGLYILEIQVY